mmetsp:Transcript_23801/g.20726  ORF Transcript_23801/g.20726 Transcript_23801/m.20726 type:complete len:230 (+) Transcript_23801:523-1212(+)
MSSKTTNSENTWPTLMMTSSKALIIPMSGKSPRRVKVSTLYKTRKQITILDVELKAKLTLFHKIKARRDGPSPNKLTEFTVFLVLNRKNSQDKETLEKTGLSTNKPSVDHGRSGTSSLIMVWLMAFTDSDKLNTQSSLPTSIKMRSRLLIMNKTSGESSVVLTFTPFKVSEVVSFWELLLTILFTPVLKLVMPKLGISLKIKMVTTALEMSSEITGSESEKMVMISLLR